VPRAKTGILHATYDIEQKIIIIGFDCARERGRMHTQSADTAIAPPPSVSTNIPR